MAGHSTHHSVPARPRGYRFRNVVEFRFNV